MIAALVAGLLVIAGPITPPTEVDQPIETAAEASIGASRGQAVIIVLPSLSLPTQAGLWCLANYCHADQRVERWHVAAIETGLVDEGVLYGDRAWRIWAPLIQRESDGDPTVAPVYDCCLPKGLTQLNGWAGTCRRAGVIRRESDLTDPSGYPNLACAAHVRDRAGIDEWRGNTCHGAKVAICNFPSWTREVLPA